MNFKDIIHRQQARLPRVPLDNCPRPKHTPIPRSGSHDNSTSMQEREPAKADQIINPSDSQSPVKSLGTFLTRIATQSSMYVPSVIQNISKVCIESFRRSKVTSSLEADAKPTDDSQRLATLWKTLDKSSVLFVALDVQANEHEPSKIIEIGLSSWCLNNGSKIHSYNWLVEDNMSSKQPNIADKISTNAFQFGSSESIKESEIGLVLDQTLHNILDGDRTLCLVGFGIEDALYQLSKYWKPSPHIIVLDCISIWRSQHPGTRHKPLRETLQETPELNHFGHLLGNSGNNAHISLCLLQSQALSARDMRGRTPARESPL